MCASCNADLSVERFDTIIYTYDALGRVASRAIHGVALTQAYDALVRAIRADLISATVIR